MRVISDNMRGAALMAAGMITFTVNDAFIKSVSDALPLWQVIFLRGIGVTICLFVMARIMGQLRFRMPRRDWALSLARGLAEFASAYFFLTALFNMPIANVSAILQSLPLTVSLAGALFLREPLGWRRLTAILIGFAGVMLIVRPGGADFNLYAVFALAAVACVTLRDLLVRRMSHDVPSMMISLVASAVVTTGAGLATLTIPWVPVAGKAALQLGGATLFLIFGYIFSVAAMRVGEIGFVAPFRYTSLLTALILGAVVFREFPQPLTLIGAGIVVATGVFTLLRERRLRLRPRVVADRIR